MYLKGLASNALDIYVVLLDLSLSRFRCNRNFSSVFGLGMEKNLLKASIDDYKGVGGDL